MRGNQGIATDLKLLGDFEPDDAPPLPEPLLPEPPLLPPLLELPPLPPLLPPRARCRLENVENQQKS